MAGELERALFARQVEVFVLDGDNVRLGLSSDLGFSASDRSENTRRIAGVIASGTFHSRAELDEQMEDLKRRHAQ